MTQAGASAADDAAPADAADDVTKAMDVPADEADARRSTARRGDEARRRRSSLPASRARLRRILVGLLVFLSCLAVVVTGLTIWAHYTVMNTDGYMNLVGPIGKDPEAIKNLSGYIGDQAVIATDLQQRVTDALPEQAQFFAGPITSAVADFITKGAQKVLSTPQAYDLWLKINRLGAREDRRSAARRIDQRLRLRQRRQAQPAASCQPGTRLGGREAAGRARRAGSARPSSIPSTDPTEADPGGRQLVRPAAAFRLRPGHPAPVGRARAGADRRQVVRPPGLDPPARHARRSSP